MNGLVGGFLPAWYAMKKDKGFVAFECMLFVLLFAFLISLCARAGGRFVALSSKLLSSWELRRAAVDLDCRFEHYFRYEALAVSIKKRSSGDVLELWTRSPYQTIQYYAAPSPQSGRETLYISAQEGMKPPGINPLTGPHLRILDFHAENRKVTRLRFPVPLSLSKTGQGAPLRRSMPMDFGRRRGVVTGVILVLIVAAASLIMNLVRSLYSRCEKQRFLWQAEQRTALFFSFCKAREGESFAREGHRLVVRGPKSGREPMYRLVVKTRKVGKALVKEEKTELQSTDEAVLRSASRYEVSTPGGRMHPHYQTLFAPGKTTYTAAFPLFLEGGFDEISKKGPDFPTGPFLQMPLRGYAYVARKKALRIPPNMAVTGRALVVAPYGAVLNDGVQLTGPMVIFSFSDIVVGQGAVLKKVFLFTPKRLIVGDYSQIDGIMAAGRSVTLGEGTRYRRDESLLTPYRTPYIF